MKTEKDYINELEILIDREIGLYANKKYRNDEEFEKSLQSFKSSITSLGTEIIHQSILDGFEGSNFTIKVQNTLKDAITRFSSMNSK